MARKFFVGGNFKMNGTKQSTLEIVKTLNKAKLDPDVEVVIAPPSIYLDAARAEAKAPVAIAAQNVSEKPNGALTGEISVAQLRDARVEWVIIGHSERRTLLGESDETVAAKAGAAVDGGLGVVWCCGESLEQREAGETVAVVTRQLAALGRRLDKPDDWARVVVAYEPIWAIGTGKVATTQQAQEAHVAIRSWIEANVSGDVCLATRVIYGGSVNEANCADLAKEKDIDGFLVGGASLKPGFVTIINCHQ